MSSKDYKSITVFVATLLCLTLVGCSSVVDDDDVVERVRVGDRLPVFTVDVVTPTIADGQWSAVSGQWSSEHLTGETVIVLFHTSCPDCQRDLPLLNAWYVEQRKLRPDFTMVAISRAEEAPSVAAFWQANSLEIPYSAQSDRRIYDLFASAVIPRIYYCSADGIVTGVDVEQFHCPQTLSMYLRFNDLVMGDGCWVLAYGLRVMGEITKSSNSQ